VRPEIASFHRFIAGSIDRLIELLESLTPDEAAWRPPANEANSILALASHVLGNAEWNILDVLAGQPIPRDRDAEFMPDLDAAGIRARWEDLKGRISTALEGLPPRELERERDHPRRGRLTGREVLIVVATHAAEHLGQAELTRDLLKHAR
jgi:hypothetical protein